MIGVMLRPVKSLSSNAMPANSMMVGAKSVMLTVSFDIRPGTEMLADDRMAGTLIPPSKVEPL